jgi:hypothetical protein
MNCPICRQPMSTFIQKGFFTDTEQAECRDETCDFHMVTLPPEEHARLTPMQIESYTKVIRARRAERARTPLVREDTELKALMVTHGLNRA